MEEKVPSTNPYFTTALRGLFLLAVFTNLALSAPMNDTDFLDNKIIPESILKEVTIALSHYPELADTPIEFKFKTNIKRSFMQAQPRFFDIFKNKKKRAYYVMISDSVTIEGEEFTVAEVPTDVLIGWIGHELGHIMDYRERSGINMVGFGIRYSFSKGFIKEAERAADTYAVNHGMGNYILATKDFILNHTSLSETYKNRIKRLYMSPEEIMVLVDELQKLEEQLD
ncbi:hypothetical protein [Planktosalinus lacus]|uniref:Uncharacterized protein n=1 Tax=Planktosalinus lacus TaxID=1526573 RepID=A0A8J2VAR8_9FLAO|nr:hypothetical protein GCM10011312_19030 [Planktosalinus lacus]